MHDECLNAHVILHSLVIALAQITAQETPIITSLFIVLLCAKVDLECALTVMALLNVVIRET